MRRRSSPKAQAGGVSLFPFLAVLLCTMGALIVVLVVIARQARIQVAEVVDESPLRSELETQKEDLQWRIDMLRESRTKTLAQLEEQRAELSHLEDHSRRLRNQLEELEHARREFEKLAAGGDVETDRLKREIDEIGAKIAAKERELDEAIKKGNKGQSYAVVPYHGPNETRRRPIYIECRRDGVVFQPEGLVLTEKDFEGDLGPGCPLVSALRAAREYLSRNQLPGEEGEAYPLLLVRPDGIVAYEFVLAAMSSWGSEFGYELVGEDWSLEFPASDPKLAVAMRQAVSEGRLRQAYLAHAAPRLRSSGHHSFRASPTGGLMRDDGMPLNAEAQMARRGGGSGRPDWARHGRYGEPNGIGSQSGGSGGGSGSRPSSGPSSGGLSQTAPRRGSNPYAQAFSDSSASGGAGGATGRYGTVASATSGGSYLGMSAGEYAAGQLNAAPGSPSGVEFRATPSGGADGNGNAAGNASGGAGVYPPGGGSGFSTTPSSNSLAAGGRGGGAPGSRLRRGRGGRGWGGGQDKIDALAASLGANAGQSPAGGGSGRGYPSGGGNGGNASAGGPELRPAQTTGNLATGSSATGNLAPGNTATGKTAPGGAEAGDASLAGGPAGTQGGKAGGNSPDGNASMGEGGGSVEGGPSSSSTASSNTAASGPASKGASSSATASQGGSSAGGRGGAQGGGKNGGQAGGQGPSSAASSSLAGGMGGAMGQPQPGAMPVPFPMPNMTLGQQPQQKSIAEQKGQKNWANPAANHAAFPVTRPIKIVCDADHLTMLPEGRTRRGYKVIEFGQSDEENARELAASVWDRIDTWGEAGQGMYWRPELIMEVEPGAEERFSALKNLMADSGLDVHGRPRSAAAIRYLRTKTPN